MEEFKFIEPELIKAGSDKLRLGLMRYAPKVDCRVLSEDTYQELKKAYDIVCESQKADTGEKQCNLPIVSKRYLLEVITSKGNSLHCSVYDDCEKAQQMYGVLEHKWKGSTTEVRLTPFNAC